MAWPLASLFFVILGIPLAIARSGWEDVVPLYVKSSAAILFVAVVVHGYAARRLLRAGYSRQDLLGALRSQYALRAEEIVVDQGVVGRVSRVVGWFLRLVAYGGAAVSIAALVLGDHRTLTIAAILSVLSGLTASIITESRRPDFWLEYSRLLWQGMFGRALFAIAGIGVRTRAKHGTATHRPTEVAIGLALGELYLALPAPQRRALADLPDVTNRLEQHAQALRGRVEQLARLLVEAGQAPRVAGSDRTCAGRHRGDHCSGQLG